MSRVDPLRSSCVCVGFALVTVLLVSMLCLDDARADCAAPTLQMAPPTDSAVPPDPELWLFTMAWLGGQPEVRVEDDQGRAVDALVVAVESDSPGIKAWRVRVDHADDAGGLRVEVLEGGQAAATLDYRIDPDWRAPEAEVVSITATEREQSAWMCSHQDTLNLALDTAASAYQVEYAVSADDWAAGKRQRVVLPADMNRFFSIAPGDVSDGPVLELGHVNCTGVTLDWPSQHLVVGVVAHHADGTHTELPDAPVELTCDHCR